MTLIEVINCDRCMDQGRIWLGFRQCPKCYGDPESVAPQPYSLWGKDGEANTLVGGHDPFRFADGSLDPDCPDCIHRFYARSWDEARIVFEKSRGIEDYEDYHS